MMQRELENEYFAGWFLWMKNQFEKNGLKKFHACKKYMCLKNWIIWRDFMQKMKED